MTKVSIIVPLYNVAPYILCCLESVAAQDYTNLEVVFVDDCGTDPTMDLVRNYLATHKFPEYRIISHGRNRGLSAARNTGLDNATGDSVYFLDSDDGITEDCIKVLTEAMEELKADVVVGSHYEQNEDGEKTEFSLQQMRTVTPMQSYSMGLWPVMAWNKLCRRDFLISNGIRFAEGMLHEDVPWSFQVAAKAKSVVTLDRLTYIYRIRKQSIMTSISISNDVAVYLRAFQEIKDFIEREGLENNRWVYRMVEGKKTGILYSLLQCGCRDLYRKYYPLFRSLRHISPLRAWKMKMISAKYLLRDLHYCLPVPLGRAYKKWFYLLFYKLRGRQIEGAVWK